MSPPLTVFRRVEGARRSDVVADSGRASGITADRQRTLTFSDPCWIVGDSNRGCRFFPRWRRTDAIDSGCGSVWVLRKRRLCMALDVTTPYPAGQATGRGTGLDSPSCVAEGSTAQDPRRSWHSNAMAIRRGQDERTIARRTNSPRVHGQQVLLDQHHPPPNLVISSREGLSQARRGMRQLGSSRARHGR